jgi:hypothetical protein
MLRSGLAEQQGTPPSSFSVVGAWIRFSIIALVSFNYPSTIVLVANLDGPFAIRSMVRSDLSTFSVTRSDLSSFSVARSGDDNNNQWYVFIFLNMSLYFFN